ncbi:MAG: hypothetical protein SV375_14980 [Thermodesulfobacteriota bacterium]|nr:hypothetical protein [Thermodesulfobacteriota bacterium]
MGNVVTPKTQKPSPRGNIYENMLVIEALEYRYNHGKRDNLNSCRKGFGNEIDPEYNISHMLPGVIKSGQTINSCYFKGFEIYKGVFQDLPFGELLIYAGNIIQGRTGVRVLDIKNFSKFLKIVDP